MRSCQRLLAPELTSALLVCVQPAGHTLEWTWRVKDYDVSFRVVHRRQGEHGPVEVDVVPAQKHGSAAEVRGEWTAPDIDSQQGRDVRDALPTHHVVLSWDNSESLFRGKQVVCTMSVWSAM